MCINRMKQRNGLGIIIGFIILAALVVVIMLNLVFDYNSRIKSIKDEYRRLGSSLSQTVSMTYAFSDSVSYFIEDFIYDNMINELCSNAKKYIVSEDMPLIMNDTVTEGFYFSERQNNDEFKISVFSGRDIYEIKKVKSSIRGGVKFGGIGQYIKNLEWLSSVEYVAIQDMNGIMTATGNVSELSAIYQDSVLQFSLIEHEEILRLSDFGGGKIYEYVHPIENTGKVLRIGFKNEDVKKAMNTQKMALFAGMLMIILFAAFAFFMLFYYNKALRLSQAMVERERDLSSIFKITKDAIIVVKRNAVSMNDSAGIIFKDGKSILENSRVKSILNNREQVNNVQVEIENKKLLLSSVKTDDGNQMTLILNDITEMEKLKEERERNERRSMLGDLSFKIAHELKNPLNGISIVLQRISKRDAISAEERDMLEDARNEVERMNRKIVDFMKYAKPIEYDFQKRRIEEIIDAAVDGVRIISDDKRVSLEASIPEDHIVRCDFEYLVIALKNIVLNAVEASEEGKKVRITSQKTGNQISLEIEDEGAGIEKENVGRIFDLYFTTKESGSGVGLANAYKILTDHKAKVSVESERKKGTKITIIFQGENNG
ncbi:MAG: HAMP domain-containing sensor histidine kinase [bacterium]|nr:HAMP domain-containing sensor histidine kinase [bacterium]